MELRVLKYFLMVAREEKYYACSGTAAYYPADAFQTDDAVGRRTGDETVHAWKT